jgi:hypothetical protein
MCVDVFAKTTLKHESDGFDASPDITSSMSQAVVKLDEILPSTFKTCEVSASTKHDTRLLVEVGVNEPVLSADMYAGVSWGSDPDADDSKDEELRTSAYGPWTMEGLAVSKPVASGCLCISACSSNAGDESNNLPGAPSSDSPPSDSPPSDSPTSPPKDVSPAAPASTAVIMPTEGTFVQGGLSLAGMRLYEWNSAAELAFRKTIAQSAQVWVNHVRVDSVAERQISSRRRLLVTNTLDVNYIVYASSESQASSIATSISAQTTSGALGVSLRANGMTAATSVSVTTAPSTIVLSGATSKTIHFSKILNAIVLILAFA